MATLPGSASAGNTQINTNNPINQSKTAASAGSGGISKEVEAGSPSVEQPGLKEVGRELPLPPEVAGAGVKIRSTTVTMPPNVQKLGVTPVNQTAPAASKSVPLTDDQIAQGLTQSITSSWRWLAEWCKRKLKQFHKTLVKSS